jgi:hypothetical protein
MKTLARKTAHPLSTTIRYRAAGKSEKPLEKGGFSLSHARTKSTD